MKFIQQAYKGNNEWSAYVVTIIILFFGWQLISIIPLIGVAFYYADNMGEFMNSANDNFTSLGIFKSIPISNSFNFFGRFDIFIFWNKTNS